MLNYQTTSFHDALYIRQLLGLQPAPEFSAWLEQQGILKQQSSQLQWPSQLPEKFSRLILS
jgi:ethanolamine ammonia-lyase large subunit